MMNYKKETIKAYDTYPKLFDKKFGEHFEYVKKDADAFIKELKGKRILDLGSGPGNHALYFKKKGFDVLCLDFSDEMLKLCKKKGLKTIKMDIEKLKFPKESFDGVWAYASLLHVPKKGINPIIKKIRAALKKDGILAIALKEGEGAGLEENESYPNTKRYFSYYTKNEIRNIFGKYFKIQALTVAKFRNYSFIKGRMRKLSSNLPHKADKP